uniref:Uncharacterized protein n=1 Tax=Arundo donax TaxID=35708 RepID=A0A0A9C0Q9_ARUDO
MKLDLHMKSCFQSTRTFPLLVLHPSVELHRLPSMDLRSTLPSS